MRRTLYAVRVTHSSADVTEWWGPDADRLREFALTQGPELSPIVPFTYDGEVAAEDEAVMEAASEALYARLGTLPKDGVSNYVVLDEHDQPRQWFEQGNAAVAWARENEPRRFAWSILTHGQAKQEGIAL